MYNLIKKITSRRNSVDLLKVKKEIKEMKVQKMKNNYKMNIN